MRAVTRFEVGSALAMLGALAACATTATNGTGGYSNAQAAPGGVVHTGQSVSAMADQYNRPHPGPAGTGASSWVAPAPAPAYVDNSPPPARAPDPAPLAAVANRQPSAAADAPRPELQAQSGAPELQAAAPTPAPAPAARQQLAALSAADVAKGRQIFANNGCGGCHTLADAGGTGGIGPGLDRNAGLSPDYVFTTVHDGRGGMPSFAGQIPDADIRLLARYIVQVSKK